MAVALNNIGRAYICLNPPWANKLFSLRALATPKGVIPLKLKPFIPSKGTAPVAALRVVAARGGVSGGNSRTQKRYAKGKRPARTLRQILGGGGE